MDWLFIIVLGIAVIVLFSRVSALRGEVERVREQLEALRTPAPRHDAERAPVRPTAQLRQRVEERREQTQHPPAAPHPPPPAPPPVAVPPPDPAPPPIVAPPRAAPPPPTLAPPPITPPPPPRHRRTRAEWEELIGGNLFNRIGILAVICAMGFFVKFAYDQQWLFRDLLAAVVGLLFLWIGHYFHRRTLHFFGHGLLGGGIALLYISVFAAAILHRLLPAPLALLLMAVVTVGAFLISLRYNAVAVALIGWAGGYLTPVLLQTGQLDDVSQLLFLILLTGGLLAVQSRRNHWAVLEPLALLSNITLYGLWFQSSYTAAHLPLAVCFVVSIWALFLALDLSRLRHAIASYPQLRTAVAVGNAAAFYLGLYLALQAAGATDWLGAVTLAVALVYAGLARRQAAPAAPPAETRYALTAVVLIVLAIYLQFRAQPFLVIGLWAAAALALLWLGAAWRRAYLWGAALSVYTLTFLVLLNLPDVFTYRAISHFNPVMNLRVLAFLALAAALAGGTLAARRLDDGPREPITITFHYAWTLLLLLLITIEVNDIYRQVNGVIGLSVVGDPHASERIVLPVLWAVYSLPLVWLGLRRRLTPLLVIGLAVLTIGFLLMAFSGITFQPLAPLLPAVNLRALLILFVIIGIVVEAVWLEKGHETYVWVRPAAGVLYVGAALLGFELLTVESTDAFRRLVAEGVPTALGVHPSLANTMLLPILWATYSLPLALLGFRRRSNALRYTGLAVLAVAAGWVAVHGSGFVPISTAYLPLLNLRAVAFGFVLAALALHGRLARRHGDADPWAETLQATLRQAMALLGAELLTLEIVGAVNLLAAHGYQSLLGMSLRTATAVALAVAWAAYATALIWYGVRRALRGYLTIGMLITALACATGVLAGLVYAPLDRYLPLGNPRAALCALLLLALAIQDRLVRRAAAFPAWQAAAPEAYRLAAAAIGFEWLTLELWQGIGRYESPLVFKMVPELARLMALTGAWALYAALLTGVGRRLRSRTFRGLGFALLCVTVALTIILGFRYAPIDAFTPVINLRVAMVAAVVSSLLLHLRWADAEAYPRMPERRSVFAVAIAALLFQAVSMETWDACSRIIAEQPLRPGAVDMRQMALSLTWIGYAIALSIYGFWRRLVALRVMALAIYLVAIGKIVFYDLRHLGSLYYIVVLFGLGAVLIVTSYLYQRYRHLLIGGMPVAARSEENTHA